MRLCLGCWIHYKNDSWSKNKVLDLLIGYHRNNEINIKNKVSSFSIKFVHVFWFFKYFNLSTSFKTYLKLTNLIKYFSIENCMFLFLRTHWNTILNLYFRSRSLFLYICILDLNVYEFYPKHANLTSTKTVQKL